MKRANPSSRRSRKSLPGQLDLFGTQNRSVEVETFNLRNTKPERARKNLGKLEAETLATISRRKDLKSSEPGGGLLDTKAAALKLGLGVSTLEKMRLQRRGPTFIKIARNLVRYRLSDLEDWIASRVRN